MSSVLATPPVEPELPEPLVPNTDKLLESWFQYTFGRPSGSGEIPDCTSFNEKGEFVNAALGNTMSLMANRFDSNPDMKRFSKVVCDQFQRNMAAFIKRRYGAIQTRYYQFEDDIKEGNAAGLSSLTDKEILTIQSDTNGDHKFSMG